MGTAEEELGGPTHPQGSVTQNFLRRGANVPICTLQ